jgi:threonylcarbamoyladenosine tRNA methylthiotransferase MtaB
LGCKTNQFESAAMGEALGREGYQLVPFDEAADIYIINTCTVTARTDAESRRLVRRAVRRNGAARVVVTGCYAQVAAGELRDLPGVSLIVGNSEKKGIAELLQGLSGEQRVLVSDIMAEERAEPLALESFAEHTRAFLQVQNGCDAFCTYCIVPYARGRSRSVPYAEVLAGISAFAGKGFREVVLTGIHLGAYGLDLTPRRELLELLREVEGEGLVTRLRVGSVEPQEISPPMIDFLAGSKVVCPHLHIPLQSGSDSVLARMGRRYETGFFRQLVERLVSAVPDLCVGLDLIAGFPGESDAEFEAGYRFVEELPVAYFHVFPYSSRPGTAAAAMAGQLPASVIKTRAERLRRLGERKRLSFHRRFIGRELPVLVQGRQKDGLLTGMARNYLPVYFAGDETLANTEVLVTVTAAYATEVAGTLSGR